MTNQERAEKIISLVQQNRGAATDDYLKTLITSQLDEAQLEVLEQNEVIVKIRICEAVREAFQEGIAKEREDCSKLTMPKVGDIHRKDGFAKGFSSAREKAAGICQEWSGEGVRYSRWQEVAERIRAMEDK